MFAKIGEFFCWMGWHNGKGSTSWDGCSIHSTCSRCNKPVMLDSQGNWFEFGQ